MTEYIALAKGKLNEPILMNSALDRYRRAERGVSLRRQAMERAWFDDLTLRRWLDSDDQHLLTSLFSQLPAERFAQLGPAIGERWGHWRGNLAYHSVPVLVRFEPDLARKCFAEPVGKRHPDASAVLGIVRALPLLPPEAGRTLLGAIAEQARTVKRDRVTRDLMWAS